MIHLYLAVINILPYLMIAIIALLFYTGTKPVLTKFFDHQGLLDKESDQVCDTDLITVKFFTVPRYKWLVRFVSRETTTE